MEKMQGTTQKTEINKRFMAIKQAFSKFIPAGETLSKYIDPTRGIFNNNRTKIGEMIDHKTLLDSHATHAKRRTSSGLQTGMTSPSRPWVKFTVDDFSLRNILGMREWIDDVNQRMIEVIGRSNLYRVFQHCYDELLVFGTGCFLILEDYEDVVRGRSFTFGEYFLGCDNKGRVNAFGREFEMTAGQMMTEFGLESLSATVKAHLAMNQVDVLIKVNHLIEANETRIPGYEDFENMPFRSVYWEANGGEDKFLAKRGYKRFQVIAPRWDTITTDSVYGYGPSWHAIGDIKELQMTHRDMLLAQEKLHNPPTVEDASVVGHSNRLPGGVTKTSSNVPNSGLRAAYQVSPNLESFINSIETLHRKIDRHMFSDLFTAISDMERKDITAFEIAKIDQERLMQLGPILHALNEEMHDKVIDIVFEIMVDNGLIPTPPEGAEGMELKVQYISILAQAEKAMGVAQIERTIAFVGNLVALGRQDAWDNIDVDFSVEQVNDLGGSPARLIVGKEKVEAIRKARDLQQQQMIAMQAAQSASETGKNLAQSPVGGAEKNMLDVIGQAAKG